MYIHINKLYFKNSNTTLLNEFHTHTINFKFYIYTTEIDTESIHILYIIKNKISIYYIRTAYLAQWQHLGRRRSGFESRLR